MSGTSRLLLNPHRRAALAVLLVLPALSGSLAGVPAEGKQAQRWTLCGGPEVVVKGQAPVIDEVAVRDLSCQSGAATIKRCIRRPQVPGWRPSLNDAGSLVLRQRGSRAGVAGTMVGRAAPLCLAARLYSPLPQGMTYLMRRDPGGYAYGYAIQRSGARVQYSWHYTVGAGVCFQGMIIPGGIRGVAVSLYPDRHLSRPQTAVVNSSRSTWLVNGEKYRVVPPEDPAEVLPYLKDQYLSCQTTWGS